VGGVILGSHADGEASMQGEGDARA
jgi:hypothetical protein